MSKVRTVLKFSEPLVFKTGLFEFGQGEAEILPKNKLPTFFVDTVYLVCERFLAKQMLYMLSQIAASKLSSYIVHGIVIGPFSLLRDCSI